MTFSEILKAAHVVAKHERKYHASYHAALGEGMKAVYASLRAGPVTTGFQVIEPWYKRQMWSQQRPAGWVTL